MKLWKRGMLSWLTSCLVLSFFLIGCNNSSKKETATSRVMTVVNEPRRDISRWAAEKADSLLVSLTLEERVGQCIMPSVFASTDETSLSRFNNYIDDYHVGGIVLLQGSVEAAHLLAERGEKAKVPLFIAIDAEWGLGMRLEEAKVYPLNGRLSKEAEESELYDYGREISEECREIGINMVLGPVVDIVGNKKGVIGLRSFGNNPDIVSNFGVAYAKGLESGGVVSVAKHFPGHGSSVIDSHKGVAKVDRSVSALDTLDLRPFRDYIKSGLTGVMAGHIQSYALDPDGKPASVSIDILTSLLREELNFKGLVLTDAFDMEGVKGFDAYEALRAGADIILCPRNVDEEINLILKKIKEGELPVSIINDRCRRILFTKYLFGIIK